MRTLLFLALFMTACGAAEEVKKFETENNSAPVAGPTASPAPVVTATPTSRVDVQVTQYGQEEPVTVTVGKTEPEPSHSLALCDENPHGHIKEYVVLKRMTQYWPWTYVSSSSSEDVAIDEAQNLVNQGMYPWNVTIADRYEDGCMMEVGQ